MIADKAQRCLIAGIAGKGLERWIALHRLLKNRGGRGIDFIRGMDLTARRLPKISIICLMSFDFVAINAALFAIILSFNAL
ncbi:MAG: hypothetical protein R3F36_05825 [Candidatus Competibacteraceae bacterium]